MDITKRAGTGLLKKGVESFINSSIKAIDEAPQNIRDNAQKVSNSLMWMQ